MGDHHGNHRQCCSSRAVEQGQDRRAEGALQAQGHLGAARPAPDGGPSERTRAVQSRNRQQATNEIPAITRHLEEKKSKTNNGKTIFSLFIAPQIHTDTKYMCGYSKYQKKLDIIPITICEFSERIQETASILDFLTDVV